MHGADTPTLSSQIQELTPANADVDDLQVSCARGPGLLQMAPSWQPCQLRVVHKAQSLLHESCCAQYHMQLCRPASATSASMRCMHSLLVLSAPVNRPTGITREQLSDARHHSICIVLLVQCMHAIHTHLWWHV